MTDTVADSTKVTRKTVNLLLAEDNPGDVRLAREAFSESVLDIQLHVVPDGQAALDFLRQDGSNENGVRPDLVLLDLDLPKVHGLEVLREIKSDPDLELLPVVILSGSDAASDIEQSYRYNTNAYLTKPVDPDDFIEIVHAIEHFWFEWAQLPTE